MKDEKIEILETIIKLKGDCLSAKLCNACPFKKKCLPQFLDYANRPSQEERFNLALDIITNTALMDDDTEIEFTRE
jgi:hypothetical protein